MQFLFESMSKIFIENRWMESNFFAIAGAFDTKINELQDSSTKLESKINDLYEIINTPQRNELSSLDGLFTENNIDPLENAVHCIQQQINKLNLMVMQNDE